MTSTLKLSLAALLRRAADCLHPPALPVVLPPAGDLPADDAALARVYEKIAFTAIAWMGHMPDPKARAAAAAILKRTYPGIASHIAAAHQLAMAFQPQLLELLRAEEAAEKKEGAAC